MKREIHYLDITLGPLQYHLQAHDDWGSELLDLLNQHVDCLAFKGPAHRQVNIVRQPITPAAAEDFMAGILPAELAALVPNRLPGRDWQITGNDTTLLTWQHVDTTQTFWTRSCDETCHSLSFNLPLDLLFHDIVRLGGGIIHGGLAVFQDLGVVVTAPPGGGKTTTLAALPRGWCLGSDDASLVWPCADGAFQVSPLPTWSVLLGVNPQLERINQWQVGNSYPLQRVLFLEKEDRIKLIPQQPSSAVYPLYHALSEYPPVIVSRKPYRVTLFRTAAALARSVPTRVLQLPRNGNFWPLLEKELSHGH